MRTKLFTTTLAVGFVAGLGAAVAAPQTVNLTAQQKKTIEQNTMQQSAQPVPAGFTAEIGNKVPNSVTLKSLPSKVASKVPSIKGDKVAKLKNKEILIVNPQNRQVVAMINENATTGSSANMNVPKSRK